MKLHEMVQHFKTQLSLERHTRKDLEDDIDGLEKENNSLMQKVLDYLIVETVRCFLFIFYH